MERLRLKLQLVQLIRLKVWPIPHIPNHNFLRWFHYYYQGANCSDRDSPRGTHSGPIDQRNHQRDRPIEGIKEPGPRQSSIYQSKRRKLEQKELVKAASLTPYPPSDLWGYAFAFCCPYKAGRLEGYCNFQSKIINPYHMLPSLFVVRKNRKSIFKWTG